VQCLPGLGGRERLRKVGQDAAGLGVGSGRQDDLIADPQQQADALGCGDRPDVEAELAEPAGVG